MIFKKREWNHKEKQKSDEMGYIEVIPFEKLNKTIDLFDMMKPQYTSIIDEKFVDIWYKIAWREKKFMKGKRLVNWAIKFGILHTP